MKKRTIFSALRGIGHWFEVRLLRKQVYTTSLRTPELKICVPADTIFSWHLAKYRSYEPEISQWMVNTFSGRLIRFVDVGANFGWFSCLLARVSNAGSSGFAFEPDPGTVPFLRQNLEINGFSDSVAVISKGIGSTIGCGVLHIAPKENPGMHSLLAMPHLSASEGIDVDTSTLDRELEAVPGRIDVIKIDIEGFEYEALLGAKQTLGRTDALVIEYSPGFLRRAKCDPSDFLALLTEQGFKLYETDGVALFERTAESLVGLAKAEGWEFFQLNLICLRG